MTKSIPCKLVQWSKVWSGGASHQCSTAITKTMFNVPIWIQQRKYLIRLQSKTITILMNLYLNFPAILSLSLDFFLGELLNNASLNKSRVSSPSALNTSVFLPKLWTGIKCSG